MKKIKIYKDEYGDKFVKVEFKFILDVPIDKEIKSINHDQVIDALFEMERIDFGEEILNNSENFHIITVNDNIKHIKTERKYVKEIPEIPKETTYLSFDVFIDVVKYEMKKGNKFAEIYSKDEFSKEDFEKIKQIGFNIYREKNKYWITWEEIK